MSKSKVVHTSVVNMQKNVGAALITKCEVPTPDGQTSKDPVNRVAPGTLGAGLNLFIGQERGQSKTVKEKALHIKSRTSFTY